MHARSPLSAAILVALSLTTAPRAIRAAEPARADRVAARTLAEAGFRALQAGDYATAVEKLEQAESTFHASTNLYFLARAFEGQGKLLGARRLYLKLVAERLPADAPKPFREAQTNASGALLVLDARLVHLRVVVAGAAPGTQVVVRVDGAPTELSDEPLHLEPRDHDVTASTSDGRSATARVPGSEPGDRTITLDLKATAVVESLAAPPPESLFAGVLPASIAFGIGAIGIGVGIGTGVASLGKVRELKDACPQNPCSSDHAPLADSARTLGTVSTVGFVVAGVGVAAGVTLLVLRRPSTKDAKPSAALRAAPTSLSLEGSF